MPARIPYASHQHHISEASQSQTASLAATLPAALTPSHTQSPSSWNFPLPKTTCNLRRAEEGFRLLPDNVTTPTHPLKFAARSWHNAGTIPNR